MSRWGYFLRRLVLAVPVVIFGTTITFVLIRMGPIDPAAAIVGIGNPQGLERIRRNLGLNQPLWQQYIEFMVDLFTFNLGQSWVIQPGVPAYELVVSYAPRTIWLGFWSVVIAVVIGIPLGFYAGLNPNTGGDYFASFGGIVWRAMPNFWLAIILVSVLTNSGQVLFGFDWSAWLVSTEVLTPPALNFLSQPLDALGDPLRLLPGHESEASFLATLVGWWINPGGDGSFLAALKAIAPGAIVLGSASMGNEMRIGRTAVLETINSKYVETARAKGVSGRSIVWKHVFRNALIPLVPIITGEAFLLIGGSVLVETVFAINGIGYLFLQAARNADLPLVGALMFIFILITVFANILQDLLYTLIDPRVGYESE